LTVAERMQQSKPQIDMSSYAGKLKILSDVKQKKYQLPEEFPTIAEIEDTTGKFQSIHY